MLLVKRIGYVFQKSWNVIAIRNICCTWMSSLENKVIPWRGVSCFDYWDLVANCYDLSALLYGGLFGDTVPLRHACVMLMLIISQLFFIFWHS